jgi:hypothetical protein
MEIIIYLSFVLVFMVLDAFVCLSTKTRYLLVNSFFGALVFPITIPVVLFEISRRTKTFRDTGHFIDELERKNVD